MRQLNNEEPARNGSLVCTRAETAQAASARGLAGRSVRRSALLLLLFAWAARADTVWLADIESGTTSPAGDYRWLDVADQVYGESYRNSYDYTQAVVSASYDPAGTALRGTLSATDLKPNFAYQVKLLGKPETDANGNERIGLAGRWWQEEWNGSQWANGQNLNNKGDGSSPNPNDLTYFARRDLPDSTSPTGKQYRYTSYLVMDYFVTDEFGGASVEFEANSSYHVLWKNGQSYTHGANDGPVIATVFDPDPLVHSAYDADYGESTVDVFGEWERLPVGGVYLELGDYSCQIMLTEESFHWSGDDRWDGGWAGAVGADIEFTTVPEPSTLIFAGAALVVLGLHRVRRARRHADRSSGGL